MELESTIGRIVRKNLSEEAWKWVNSKALLANDENKAAALNLAFASVPRQTGKRIIDITAEERAQMDVLLPGLNIQGWTIDRLCRVWLLMQVDPADKDRYFSKIENLFLASEINELVALYSALPVLAYPESWKRRCAEGIRSNIGAVLEAIMYQNPYPATWLEEPAWNQLVLKAFFTDKHIGEIIGIDRRANRQLSFTLLDYAKERHSAGRSIDPMIWTMIEKFIDKDDFGSIQKSFEQREAVKKE